MVYLPQIYRSKYQCAVSALLFASLIFFRYSWLGLYPFIALTRFRCHLNYFRVYTITNLPPNIYVSEIFPPLCWAVTGVIYNSMPEYLCTTSSC